MDTKKIVAALSIEEKATLVAGHNFMNTAALNDKNVRALKFSDGPHGLRLQKDGGDNGVTASEPATAFPTAATVASGWNEENAFALGKAIAKECVYYGVDVLLGPGANIKRNALGGRNFEYFSEDPLLSGKMAAAEIKGVQSFGVGTALKHFALNNYENYRFMGNSVCDERAMREIYLKSFEIAVKEGAPETVMCAYNKVNGVYASENKRLIADILRKEWGYGGLTMTDWGGTHDRLAMLRAGLDLEMPGDTAVCKKSIIDGIKSGALDESVLDEAVENVLRLVSKHENRMPAGVDFTAHHNLAASIAADCAVLLKNDGVLPLSKREKYCVLGELFEKPRYQGAGSSMINPTFLSSPKDAFDARGVEYEYAKGYKENTSETDGELLKSALKLAEAYDKVLVFAGLTDLTESEGADRENMRLSENQSVLIETLIRAGKKTVIVLYGGSPIELPFADGASAILDMYLPGQNGGEATAALIFGEKSPSGKLAETWPKTYSDVPLGKDFGKTKTEVYRESVFVGYRYYLTAGVKPRYPFGYGLSYTTFVYKNATLTQTDDEIIVDFEITNDGNYDGAEIAQLYVRPPKSEVFMPVKELKGYKKVYLKAGETKSAKITVKKSELGYFNIKAGELTAESGEYAFELCSDCETVKLVLTAALVFSSAENPYSKEVNAAYIAADINNIPDEIYEELLGEKIPAPPPLFPITTESRFSDLKYTFMGKPLYFAVTAVARKELKAAKKLPEGAERDNRIKGAIFLKRVLESNSLTSMSMCAGDKFPFNYAEGFADLANFRLFSGIKKLLNKIPK